MQKVKIKITQKKDVLLQIGGCVLIICELLYYLRYINIPYIVPDEFGYWSAASFIAGYDWSGVTIFNSYYSFGYGIVLAPLLRLFRGVSVYKAAIFLNAIFLCCIFLALKKINDKIYGKSCLNTIISLCLCFYASNASYAKTAQCEIFLCFCYILCILLWVEILDKVSNLKCISFGLTLGLMYCTHMRSVGIVLVACIGMLYLFWKKRINKKQIMLFMIIIILIGILSYFIQKLLIQELYSNGTTVLKNTYASQVSNVKSIFKFSGMKKMIFEYIGQMWYLGAATCLVIYIAIYNLIKNLITNLKNKDINKKKQLYELMIFLGFFATLTISAVAAKTGKRIDCLIYGRYSEFAILPVVFLGLAALLHKTVKMKALVSAAMVYLIFTLIVHWLYIILNYTDVVYTSVTGIFKFIWGLKENFELLCCLWTTGMFCLICLFYHMRERIEYIHLSMILLICTLNWYINGIGFTQNEVKGYQNTTKVVEIENYIEDANIEKPVYYVYDSNDTSYNRKRIFILQFLLKDITIRGVEINDISAILDKEYYVVINKNSLCREKVKEKYEKLVEGNPLILYQEK